MSDLPKISIITVVYNGAATIEDTVRSVLSQDYPSVEYIIIDGASKDDTLARLNPYRDRIAQLVSEPDKGIWDAMNKGLKRATGDVIGILNSDDVYAHSGVLSKIMQSFEANPMAEAVYGNLKYMDTSLTKVIRNWKSRAYDQTFFEYGEMPPHPTFFARRSLYDKIGYIDMNFRLGADYELTFRAMRVYQLPTYWVDECLVHMRIGGESNRSVKNIIDQHRLNMKAWTIHGLKVPLSFHYRKFLHRLKQFL
ncbi:glycosyltransferase family 2 protein [Siphonobacter sp. SORGH_AS_0500]|uniref:glycosyltransferase family 2 protein n=1 Tax=Siphonobacter sp. SORGH_AS_0500 TaxID=1864824 RepID=UPI002864B470|nr:glycosyltransferase family 2 protein [Siphonobacter sp. SORGH_AS_0500]MDR6193699.1 glycosyltransferase involved in cell wall biosynthesis [Siphonobacter sp. SORGH_AS_0500]